MLGTRAATEVLDFNFSNTAVGTTLEIVGDPILLHGLYTDLSFVIENDHGSVDLADLSLQYCPDTQTYTDTDWRVLLAGTADWISTTIRLKDVVEVDGSQTDLSLLDFGTKGAAKIYLPHPCYAIRFMAKSASSNISLNIHGSIARI